MLYLKIVLNTVQYISMKKLAVNVTWFCHLKSLHLNLTFCVKIPFLKSVTNTVTYIQYVSGSPMTKITGIRACFFCFHGLLRILSCMLIALTQLELKLKHRSWPVLRTHKVVSQWEGCVQNIIKFQWENRTGFFPWGYKNMRHNSLLIPINQKH